MVVGRVYGRHLMKVVSLLSAAPRFGCVLIRRQLGSLFSFSALIIPLRFDWQLPTL